MPQALETGFYGPSLVKSGDFRLVCLFAAVLLYGLLGTPTPDSAGMVEITVALLLVAALGPSGAFAVFRQGIRPPWQKAGQVLLYYGLSVPLITGLLHGNAAGAMARDVIPFLFMMMPLFFSSLFAGRIRITLKFTLVVAAAGLLFAARVLSPLFVRLDPAALDMVSDPFYLANAPTVLFAAILLAGRGGRFLYNGPRLNNIFYAALYIGLAVIPVLAMALIVQRATMGVFTLSVMGLLATAFIHRPLKALLPMFVLAALIALFSGFLGAVGQDLAAKTGAVGINSRWAEAQAVFDLVDDNILSALFGHGWGAVVVSPAAGGVPVNFTHSLITTFLLKTGLLGLSLVLYYLGRLALLVTGIFRRHPVLAFALAGPLAIDVLLYASFKSLDFGLLLLLVPLWSQDNSGRLRANAQAFIEKSRPVLYPE